MKFNFPVIGDIVQILNGVIDNLIVRNLATGEDPDNYISIFESNPSEINFIDNSNLVGLIGIVAGTLNLQAAGSGSMELHSDSGGTDRILLESASGSVDVDAPGDGLQMLDGTSLIWRDGNPGLIFVDGADLLIVADNWVYPTTWTPQVVQGGGFTETVGHAMYEVSNGWCSFSAIVTIAAGNGTAGQTITITLPVPCSAAVGTITPIGAFRGTDTSNAANNRGGEIILSSTTVARFGPSGFTGAGGVWGNNPNFGLAPGDVIAISGRYPIA